MKRQTFLAQNSSKFWLHKIKAFLVHLMGEKGGALNDAFVFVIFRFYIKGKPGAQSTTTYILDIYTAFIQEKLPEVNASESR